MNPRMFVSGRKAAQSRTKSKRKKLGDAQILSEDFQIDREVLVTNNTVVDSILEHNVDRQLRSIKN